MGGPFYDGNATYTWTSSDGQDHMLTLAFVNNDYEIDIHTEWYVPGYEATTLGATVGPDFAVSVIYAAGDSPPTLPC